MGDRAHWPPADPEPGDDFPCCTAQGGRTKTGGVLVDAVSAYPVLPVTACRCDWYVEPHGEWIPDPDPDCPVHTPSMRLDPVLESIRDSFKD